DNGEQLARLLDLLLAVYPLPVRELVLIGHSMGGLVARSACEQAAATHQTWPGLTRMVICLGSPHQGAPLEKLGQLTTVALGLSSLVAPLGKIANARSAGIKDLRHGLRATGTPPGSPGIAYRLIGASLTQRIDHPIGQLLGDGLVTLGSATATDLADDVDTVRLGGLHHMELLNTPRVYRHIHDWLAMPEQSTAPET
ncbi:MAG: alpha/beta hydrolase, partial [Candidatus Competibacteraceae bacterium]